MSNPEDYFAYLIPTVHQRLANDEIVEPTEEIRLLLVECLAKLVALHGKKCGEYIDEFVQILKQTVSDPFPDVKKVREVNSI